MPTELKDDLDEQEELNIGDDETNNDDTDTGGSDDEPEDRGDDFVDPEAEVDGANGDTGDTDSKPDGDANTPGDQDTGGTPDKTGGDSNDAEGNIPASRLGEVARAKSAATAIADGLVDGSIDPSVVRDFGGAAAVAKAIANREMSLDDLKTGIVPFKQDEQQQQQAVDQNSPSTWDLDSKYVEYQELVDAGETKEAATLLRQINKEERARERAEERQQSEQQQVVGFVQQLITDFPVLANTKSPEHESVMVWANHLQVTKRISRVEALKQAIEKVGLVKSGAENGNDDDQQTDETPQQRTLRLRKEAAIKKAAAAQNQQPPPMGLGATPQGAKQVDIDKLGEDDFARLSKEEKAALRGDKL